MSTVLMLLDFNKNKHFAKGAFDPTYGAKRMPLSLTKQFALKL